VRTFAAHATGRESAHPGANSAATAHATYATRAATIRLYKKHGSCNTCLKSLKHLFEKHLQKQLSDLLALIFIFCTKLKKYLL
jgi:hypothetical protein